MFAGAAKKTVAFVILVAIATVLWWQRSPLLSRYEVYRLAQADDNEVNAWVERVAALEDAALPQLFDLLRHRDAKGCANAASAMKAIAHRWGASDARTAKLGKDLFASFQSVSDSGRHAILEWYRALLPDLGSQSVESCRVLATQGMASKESCVCAAAVRLTMVAPLNTDKGLVDRVVPLLRDDAPEVRRTAVLALGLAEEAVTVEDLLPMLQDADAEVRRLCEAALRGRGLQENHIKLAKLITDQRPGQRLQVVHYLSDAGDLDPGIWLLRLSQDPSPAVRAAAVRFAAEDPAGAVFHDHLVQMSQADPSPTVRELAAFYLKMPRPRH